MHKKIMSVYLPHSLAKKTKDLAERDGSRVAGLIRFLIAEAVRNGHTPKVYKANNSSKERELLVTIKFALSPELAEAMRKFLRKEGLSISAFVTALLRDWVNKRTNTELEA